MSWPSNTTEPLVSGYSRAMHRASVDLPQPDSPTRPSVSPARSSKLTSSTACTRATSRCSRTPLLIGKYFVTCSARSSSSPSPFPFAGTGGARREGVGGHSAVLDQLRVDGGLPQFLLLLGLEVAGVQVVAVDPGRAAAAARRTGSNRCAQRSPKAHPSGSRSSEGGCPGIVARRLRLGPVQPGDRAEQAPGVGMLGVVEDLPPGCPARRSAPRTSPRSGRPCRPPPPCRG